MAAAGKSFLSVFASVPLGDRQKKLLSDVSVDKLSLTSTKSLLRVYITAGTVIKKSEVYSLERAVEKHVFPGLSTRVRIYESYALAPAKSAETIFSEYLGEMLTELKNADIILFTMLKGARADFSVEGRLGFFLEDTPLFREHEEKFLHALEKIFIKRFGLAETLSVEFDAEKKPAEQKKGAGKLPASFNKTSERRADQTENSGKSAAIHDGHRRWGGLGGQKHSVNPDVLLGKDFPDRFTPLSQADEEQGEAIVRGQVLDMDSRLTKTGKTLFIFHVTDFTDTITVKHFAGDDTEARAFADIVKPGVFLKLHGTLAVDRFDGEVTLGSLRGIKKCEDFRAKREDHAEKKRVELHLHTKMSDMDGVSDVKDIIAQARRFGMKAMAVTDHGCVQAFPDAYHATGKDDDFKVIYGVEGYLVDDGEIPAEKLSLETVKKLKTYHIIILAKNETGRVNLYRLVSESHSKYFARRPRIPRSLLTECREGLILGSACEAGELCRALVSGKSEEELLKIADFYDYLEVQPLGNNEFMLRDKKSGMRDEEDLKNINRTICRLGEILQKPVCATCDVHFLNPEDEIYRRIIMAGSGFADADRQAPLFLRTTEEMLEEFSYLGKDKAYEIVVENTNLICDMCDRIAPVRPDKCPPVIENSDVTLRNICYDRARELYGENLPDQVKDRMEKELNSIISNGFAVMYIIAQKLVWKSNEDGYLVGSRGSVGSSLVAYLAGITEVNSLAPHYLCGECHYVDFDSKKVKAFSGMAGCDMPDAICPVCGKKLQKLGFDIPFETFLGFKGDKEPDIDLNFSGEYQSKAHDYTEVIFGKGQTFRAGTIGALADKTAYGMVKHYFEDRGQRKRGAEIDRIVKGCVGVRRTTGQHPGGIVVLPIGENIYSFTPIQHPANDMTTKTITTHFDYHSIDHNLLKLDILGHDDPTMIRMLQDLTGIDPVRDIPLDDKGVMSLFADTSALKISPEDIGGCRLGALGIPEFGTDFAMQMLIDARPKYFSDLVRIAGLAHGTDVWLGNAKDLILSGTATIQTAICCRDDIMVYLISMGVEEGLSFTIMESVRKGKGLKPEWIDEMKAHGVPQWYIDSCLKIKYMFPKAHAAAYVMMAWRVAYCKVYYPLAYYASFFSIRASGFSYELMCQGRETLEKNLEDFKKRRDSLTNAEQDTLRDMRIAQEMYARGFEFMPIDIYRAKASRFQIIDGKIMPSFMSIAGMGGKAAESLEDAAAEGQFLSQEDMRKRGKVSKTMCELMEKMGLLGDMPKENQLSLFDLMA